MPKTINIHQRNSDRGVALVHNIEDYKKFLALTLDESLGIFDDIYAWYRYFCEEDCYFTSDIMDDVTNSKEDIANAIDDLFNRMDDDKHPASYPALIIFDFENFNPYIASSKSNFMVVPLEDLDVTSITTNTDSYTLAFSDV